MNESDQTEKQVQEGRGESLWISFNLQREIRNEYASVARHSSSEQDRYFSFGVQYTFNVLVLVLCKYI